MENVENLPNEMKQFSESESNYIYELEICERMPFSKIIPYNFV